MTLINLTPHTLNIIDKNGKVVDIPVSGTVARCEQYEQVVRSVGDIVVTKQTFGEVVNLPEKEAGVSYIVSRLVAAACPERDDLLIPGPLVRDEEGRVVGCRGLSVLL